MKNKRASLSTLLFVVMVFVVCFFSLYSFVKHKNISEREFLDINSFVRANFQDEVSFLEMKIFSEEAIFYAYNQLINYYGFNLESSDGNVSRVFDYSRLKSGNPASELIYKTKFESLAQDRYDLLVSSYPQYTLADKEISLALKNAKFSFDGKNIFVKTSVYVKMEDSSDINLSYSKAVEYNSSLELFSLIDLRKFSGIAKSCQFSEINLRKECVLAYFPGFKFDNNFEEFKIINNGAGDFYLVKLVSEKGYFIGSVEGSSEEVIFPSFYFVLPIKEEDQSKIESLFGNLGGEYNGPSNLDLLPLEKTLI